MNGDMRGSLKKKNEEKKLQLYFDFKLSFKKASGAILNYFLLLFIVNDALPTYKIYNI